MRASFRAGAPAGRTGVGSAIGLALTRPAPGTEVAQFLWNRDWWTQRGRGLVGRLVGVVDQVGNRPRRLALTGQSLARPGGPRIAASPRDTCVTGTNVARLHRPVAPDA